MPPTCLKRPSPSADISTRHPHGGEQRQLPGGKEWELPEVGAARSRDPHTSPTPQGKSQGAAHRRERALDESEMLADRKALEESHAPDHLDPPQGQEVAERDEAEEASEGARRAPRRGKADTRSQGAGAVRSRSGQEQGPPDESEPQRKIQGAAHRLEGAPRLALNERDAGSGLKEEALRRWIREQVARMDKLQASLDQKRRELAMHAPVREKKGSAEEGRRYGAQEEWKREEMRRLRQQTKRDQNKRAHEQGRGEGRNLISNPLGTPLQASAPSTSKPSNSKPPAGAVWGGGRKVKTGPNAAFSQDYSDSLGDEELRRAVELSCQEGEGAGRCHGEELEEEDPDLASPWPSAWKSIACSSTCLGWPTG